MSRSDPPRDESELRRRLVEAEETLDAIRHGEVDAVVVDGARGQQIYCLESPDEPFRMFVERMQEGALTVSDEGTVVYCNPFFANLVQRPIEQVRGQPLGSFIEPSHRQRLENMIRTASDEVVHGESLLQNAAGDTVPVQLAFNRLPPQDTRMFGVVVTDLTERQRAERLEMQRQAAEEAKAARDHFLATVSHELRAPLSAILGWVQVLQRRDDLPELVQQGLEVILRNAWAQSHLIEDLLDVSRVLAGKLRLESKPVDLVAVARAAVASAQPEAALKHIDIAVHAPASALPIRGDANRVQQIVLNLLSNAIKFSGKDAEVQVTLAERAGAAEITVSDTGVGIAPENLSRIFDLYHQIGDGADETGGLGLGLPIVKQLAELHGGEVFARSAGTGRGAEFTIRLPLLEDAEAGAEAAPARQTAALAGLRLLAVEDQPDEREAIVQLFTSIGAEVTALASAAEALEAVERQPFDVLLCDVDLPDMSGYELIRRIRAGGLTGRLLPAVAITATASREARREALVAGFQIHLTKPLDQDELHAVVANLAGPDRGGDSNIR